MSWESDGEGYYAYVVDGEVLARVDRSSLREGCWRSSVVHGDPPFGLHRTLEAAQAAALKRLPGCLWCHHGCRWCRPIRRARAWWPPLLRAARTLLVRTEERGWDWTASTASVLMLADECSPDHLLPLPDPEEMDLAREAIRVAVQERSGDNADLVYVPQNKPAPKKASK